jgi:hypothetical protein
MMDVFRTDQRDATVKAGTTIVVMYCPPDRDVGRVTRTIDLQAHLHQFAAASRTSIATGVPDVHQGRVGDAWAAELWTSGVLEWVCGSAAPCTAHEDWMTAEHDYDYTIAIYPHGAKSAWHTNDPPGGSVANTDGSVRRGCVNSLYAANPNSWSMMRFCARTVLSLIPSSWPL